MSRRLETRVVDPSRCWVRHVRRTRAGETAGATVAGAAFTAQPLDALGGRQGWVSAEVSGELSGDGGITIRFPNAAGEDGVLHRRRFAIITDPAYRPGEEWLELAREPGDTVAVATPQSYTLDRSTLSLKCIDVATHLTGYRGSELDVWDGHAPRDVFEHYTRLPALVAGADFAGFAPASGAWNGWTVDPAVTVGPTSGQPRITAVGAWSGLSRPLPGLVADNWVAEARVRIVALGGANGWVLLRLGSGGAIASDLWAQVDAVGQTVVSVPGLAAETQARQGFTVPLAVNVRIVARNERLFVLVNGELMAELRRPTPLAAPANVYLHAWTATVEVDDVHVEHLAPYALRGTAKGDRHLPGLPPPVGLRARYYNAAGVWANQSNLANVHARLFKTGDEPIIERLDATIDTAAGTAAGTMPPGIPGAWAARWVGAIWLDLAASDRRVRLTPSTGNGRLYIGRTNRDDPAASSWGGVAGTVLTTANLRAFLGESVAGWFPIVVEVALASAGVPAGGALRLEDAPVDAAGNPTTAYATVPTSRLSPVGVVEDELRNESCRTVLDNLATTFGLQWRTDPRALETGEFPGQIIPLVRVGRDTELVIDDLDGVDLQVEGDASDAIDSLIADAAGIADPKGSGQLSAQVTDYAAAGAHLGIATGYETLSEVSEAAMLETRLGNLLALRSSPNEQVGVRPTGQQDLVDSFPLSGQLALMKWRPGDGVRLELDDVDVIDRTPRQMTSVSRVYLPAGVTVPTVAFRQRPRSSSSVLKRTMRAAYALSRNYQGTLAMVSGAYIAQSLAAAGASGYSYLPLPQNLDDLSAVFVDVASLNTGTVTLEVLGVAGPVVSAPGRYDVTRWVKAESNVTRRVYVRAMNASVALGIEFQLVAVVRL